VLPSLADGSISLTLTDIPYDEVNRKSGGLRNLDKSHADIITFPLDDFIDEVVRVTSGSIYIFCGSVQVSHIRSRLIDRGLSVRHCIWEKTNPSPMNGQYIWLSSIENCVFAKKSGAVFNEHCKSAVWRNPIEHYKDHPTPKPFIGVEFDKIYFNITEDRIETAVRGAGEKKDLISFMKD
jgi:site-specific DNA-methyltransferase (adenine-specific)